MQRDRMKSVPGAPQISFLGIGCVHNCLCICHIVNGCNAPMDNSNFVQHDLDNGPQAICGT